MARHTGRRTFLKRSLVTGGVLASGPSLAGCLGGGSGGGSSTLKVGVLSMLETDTGKATERGVELAAEAINAAGTIDQEIELVSEDTQGTATGAVEAYSNLVDRQNVDVTLGAFAESAAAGIMPNIADSQTVHLNVGAVSPALTAKLVEDFEKYKYWFRLAPPNSQFFGVDFLRFAERFMTGEMGWSSVGLYREDAAWTNEIAPFLKEEFPKMDLSIEGDVVFPISENNFSPYLSQFEDMDVDCIFAMVAEAGKTPIQGYAKSSLDVPIVGDVVAVQSPSYLDDMGGKGQNVVGRTHSTWSAKKATDASKEFIDAWTETYSSRPQQPTWAGLGAYAATNVLANAVSRAGTKSAEELIPEVENADYELIQRYQVFGKDEEDPITGSRFPHDLKYGPDHYESTWSQWRDGEQVTIWPQDLATGEFQQV